MSSNLLTFINRLFTSVLLVVMLFACQNTSEGNQFEGFQPEYQAN